MILRGECPAGSKLRQQPLADHFGVAQGVVREALLELEVRGWVQSIDHRGAYVIQIDARARAQAVEIRAMHESLAVRLCCDRVNRADLRELSHLAERACEAAAGSEGEADGAALDREFHGRLFRLSDNELLAQLSENYRFRAASLVVARERSAVRAEHLALLRAIQDGRAEDAERVVREHIAADAG
jgi:DNA-binding GntR family transcriptional regulator